MVSVIFLFNDTATTEIYTYLHTLSLHDALPIVRWQSRPGHEARRLPDCLRPALDEIIRRQPGWILLGTANESHELGTAFYIPSRRSVLIIPFDHDIAAEECCGTNYMLQCRPSARLLKEAPRSGPLVQFGKQQAHLHRSEEHPSEEH